MATFSLSEHFITIILNRKKLINKYILIIFLNLCSKVIIYQAEFRTIQAHRIGSIVHNQGLVLKFIKID